MSFMYMRQEHYVIGLFACYIRPYIMSLNICAISKARTFKKALIAKNLNLKIFEVHVTMKLL